MLVKVYVKQWKRFTIFTHYMRKLFSYLVSENQFDYHFHAGSLSSEEQQCDDACNYHIAPVQRSLLRKYQGAFAHCHFELNFARPQQRDGRPQRT